MSTQSVGGGGNEIKIYGDASVGVWGNVNILAGNGNDTIALHGSANISVGGGSDSISITGNGVIRETGFGGHDTINVGSGSDTIFVQGQATVHAGGNAYTISNEELIAVGGNVTLVGASGGHSGASGDGDHGKDHSGSSGHDTSVGGSSHDTGIGHGHVVDVHFGQHVITNFVSGQDKLYVEGHTLSYLQNHHDITSSGGNTFISLDGGATTVELKGIGSVHSSDITTHGK